MKRFGLAAAFAVTMTGCAATAVSTPPRQTATPLLSTAVTTSAETTEIAATATPTPTTAATTPEQPAAPEPIPTACVGEQSIKDTSACLPPGAFITKMCGASYPDLALAMFAKGTPWTRVWLSGDVEAWSASGGFTSRSNLAFDEEVLVLSRHAAPSSGAISISGNTSFDVLRWDGSCVSVMEGELTTKRPPAPKSSTIAWNRLEDGTKHALLGYAKVKSARDVLDKACSGERQSCDRAEKDLANSVAHAVRSGKASLPTPTHRP